VAGASEELLDLVHDQVCGRREVDLGGVTRDDDELGNGKVFGEVAAHLDREEG
jgi:hypothetical protein